MLSTNTPGFFMGSLAIAVYDFGTVFIYSLLLYFQLELEFECEKYHLHSYQLCILRDNNTMKSGIG